MYSMLSHGNLVVAVTSRDEKPCKQSHRRDCVNKIKVFHGTRELCCLKTDRRHCAVAVWGTPPLFWLLTSDGKMHYCERGIVSTYEHPATKGLMDPQKVVCMAPVPIVN